MTVRAGSATGLLTSSSTSRAEVGTVASSRSASIDWLRGLVMVIMLADHAREFLTVGSSMTDPVDLSATSIPMALLRMATHLCAPTFVLLAGVSAFLYGDKTKDPVALRRFLYSRGLWLILLELTVINTAWTFHPFYPKRYLQVIWAIGVSMVALGALSRMRPSRVLAVGLCIVATHNLLDFVTVPPGSWLEWPMAFLHVKTALPVGDMFLRTSYPVLPWIGVICIGYGLGPLFGGNSDRDQRIRILRRLALGAASLFVVLRVTNLYGEPQDFVPRGTVVENLVALVNTTKYPPSLLFLLWTGATAFLILSLVEGRGGAKRGPESSWLTTVGSVPLFFYVAHLYLVHAMALGYAWAIGHDPRTFDFLENYGGLPRTLDASLSTILAATFLALALLYPACVWYRGVKRRNKHWIFRYL